MYQIKRYDNEKSVRNQKWIPTVLEVAWDELLTLNNISSSDNESNKPWKRHPNNSKRRHTVRLCWEWGISRILVAMIIGSSMFSMTV